MGWILSVFVSNSHIFIINLCADIITNKSATFQYSEGTPLSCRSEPPSPLYSVRALVFTTPSTAIAIFEYSEYSSRSTLCSNENKAAVVNYYHVLIPGN